MQDIFISYASQDEQIAETLANALEKEGFDVWWDKEIPTGKTFDDVIEKAIKDANCVIVLWSEHSINSEWVHIEAAEGKERNILIPIKIADVPIPFAFKRRQTADLSNWTSGKPDLSYDRLIVDIRSMLSPEDQSADEANASKKTRGSRSTKKQRHSKASSEKDGIRINKKYLGVGGLLLVAAALIFIFSDTIKGFLGGGPDGPDTIETAASINKADLKIGDPYEGGIIFQIEENGESFKICSDIELGSFNWEGAKMQCQAFSGGGFTDWYLPSKEELNLIYINLSEKGLDNFNDDWYWSSTETDGSAWEQFFPNGNQQNNGGGNESFSSVRAIRSSNLNAKKIGDTYAGGIIFQLDATGQHGKVCSDVDLGFINWYDAKTKCEDFNGEGFTDWYLPSKDELNLIYFELSQKGLGNFNMDWYWSSTETDGAGWEQRFGDGAQQNNGGGNESFSLVRAVRSF